MENTVTTDAVTSLTILLMRRSVSEKVLVKASTGIRTKEDCDRLIAAGAVRFGSSAGPKVVDGEV